MMMSMDVFELKGVDLMVLNYLRKYGTSSAIQIRNGTGCVISTVYQSLTKLCRMGMVECGYAEFGHRAKVYKLNRSPEEDILVDIDVCAKHYKLSGAQIQFLRDTADRFDEDNRRIA